MTKNQKLAIGISSSFLVVILVVLSLVSSAGPSGVANPVVSNSSIEICEAQDDFWEYNSDLNSWIEKASFNGGNRISAVAFSIGEKGYITTGEYELNNSTVYTKDLWEWNSATNVWTQRVDLPGAARSGATGFAIGRRGYVGTGGNEAGLMRDFWEYDGDINSGTYNTWIQKANFGGVARTAAVGFPLAYGAGSKGYIGTGVIGVPPFYAQDFWEWDQLTNTWTQKADYGGGERTHAIGFSVGELGYIGTGKSLSGYKKDLWGYDPILNKWTQKADVGGDARINAVGFSTDSYGYVGTGTSLNGRKADFWEYDQTTNTWIQKADYGGGPTDYAVGFSIRNTGYIGTGFRCEGEPPLACTPDSWTKKADFGGSPRWFASGFAIGTNGYIGGSGTMADPKDFWEWDQATNVWTRKADYGGGALHSATGFSIGNLGYIGTGTGTAYYKDFWQYDPSVNTWTKKADFGGNRRKDAVGFSIGAKGYMGTGQFNDTQSFKDFWEYDQATNVWTQKADFGGTARFEAAGFALGKKGYIGTGRDLNNNAYKDFWEWDQATNTWTKKADFGGVVRHAATGISIGDKGYIGTGGSYFQSNASYKDFWKYDVATNTWTRKADYPGIAGFQAVGFSIGDLGYIGTGYNFASGPAKDFWEYCPD